MRNENGQRGEADSSDRAVNNGGAPSFRASGTGYSDREALAACRAIEALSALCMRVDGWLRIVSHNDGQTVYFKYKFTSKRWPNHYVMYVEREFAYGAALVGLLRKVEDVDLDLDKPVEDRPYDR